MFDILFRDFQVCYFLLPVIITASVGTATAMSTELAWVSQDMGQTNQKAGMFIHL